MRTADSGKAAAGVATSRPQELEPDTGKRFGVGFLSLPPPAPISTIYRNNRSVAF